MICTTTPIHLPIFSIIQTAGQTQFTHQYRASECSSDDLERPWKVGHNETIFFWRISVKYARTVWSRTTKLGMVTRGGGHVSRVGHGPHPKGAAPQRPQSFWDPYVHGKTVTKFCYVVIKQDDRKIFTRWITPPCPGQKFLWRECSDLFGVADLVVQLMRW